MKEYCKEPVYAREYIGFALMVNNKNDTADLFERFLSCLDPQDALPLWEEYRSFCSEVMGNGGDLIALRSVEERMAAAYPGNESVRGLLGITHRYSCYNSFFALASTDDRGFFTRNRETMVKMQDAGSSVMVAQAENTAQVENVQVVVDEIPPFLTALVSLLPKKIRGLAPDADTVLNQLRNFKMPPRPTEGM